MNTLIEYVLDHTNRWACTCGHCLDATDDKEQPSGHTADLVFFKVSAKNNPNAEKLRSLVKEHPGDFGPCDLFDGKEHSYLEVGAFVGDQGLAMQLMGLGALLGLWKLLTPRSIFGDSIPEDLARRMAERGYIAIQAGGKATS